MTGHDARKALADKIEGFEYVLLCTNDGPEWSDRDRLSDDEQEIVVAALRAQPGTVSREATDEQLTEWAQWLDWDTDLSIADEIKQLRSLLKRIGFQPATPPIGLTIMAWDDNSNRHYEPVELLAEKLYERFDYEGPGQKPKWIPRGNALKQDQARLKARDQLRKAGHKGSPLAILSLSPPAAETAGVWSASKHDEIIKRLMADVGMPNSNSLYGAFKQFANELHALATPADTSASVVGDKS
jgi:hypothetical protein